MAIIVKVNTDIMKAQSNQVRDDIKEVQRQWQNIGKLIDGTRTYWEGEASDAHIKIYRDIKGDVDKVIQRLGENAVKLQQMAGVYDPATVTVSNITTSLPNDVF